MPYLDKVMQITDSHSGNLDGCTTIDKITGETPDISKYIDFGFYNLVIYKNKSVLGEVFLGIFLDVSHGVRSLMSYWIFLESVIPISISTIQRVTLAELNTDVTKQRCGTFDKSTQDNSRMISFWNKANYQLWSSILSLQKMKNYREYSEMRKLRRLVINLTQIHLTLTSIWK